MPRTPVATDSTPTSHLAFSPAVRAGDFVYVSGQASVDDTGAYVPGTFEEEMDLSMRNLSRIVEAAGGSMDDVVQLRAYLGDFTFRDQFNAEYPSYFNAPFPARTTIAAEIGDLKFEVDAMAYIPQERSTAA